MVFVLYWVVLMLLVRMVAVKALCFLLVFANLFILKFAQGCILGLLAHHLRLLLIVLLEQRGCVVTYCMILLYELIKNMRRL